MSILQPKLKSNKITGSDVLLNNWDVGYKVTDESGKLIRSKNPHKSYESSSTLKTALMHLFLNKVSQNELGLDHVFSIKDSQRSNGSGIVNWTDWNSLPLHAVIELTCVYSDCTTTNMIIDYLGGQQMVNELFKNSGYKYTKLNQPSLMFDESKPRMESVGTTTPDEASKWLRMLLEDFSISPEIKQHFITSTQSIHTPWLDLGAEHHPLIKTGSMIDIGPAGTSVFNANGRVSTGKGLLFFAFFSRGDLRGQAVYAPEEAKRLISKYIQDTVLKI
ncbi:MAG: beta-lactamase [Candidatus Saccharibacteria bacterium]|nr:beta-lactamase [Candidatus Saccharibacteria bacterium]